MSLALILLAFDPGPHTAVATFCNGELSTSETFGVDLTKAARYGAIQDVINQWRGLGRVSVVCETFRSRVAGVGAAPSAIETYRLTGWIEGLALTWVLPFTWQDPAYKTAFMEQARRLPHSTVHEMDAIAHGLAWFARQQRQGVNGGER